MPLKAENRTMKKARETMEHTREEIIAAIRAEIRDWGATPPEFVTVPAPFLRDVLRLLEAEGDDGK